MMTLTNKWFSLFVVMICSFRELKGFSFRKQSVMLSSSRLRVQFDDTSVLSQSGSTSSTPEPSPVIADSPFSKSSALPQPEKLHYLSKEDRPYLINSKPGSGLLLGLKNFQKELTQIFVQVNSETFGKLLQSPAKNKVELFPEIFQLRLSNEDVKAAEMERERTGGRVDAHPVSRLLYDIGCLFLDKFFDERPLARFWFLETVARIPYFVYVSMLHLYESFGWWREASVRKVHYAEEWNELHHLLIMEALGADKKWSDRFLGYHAAILYYWLLIATYAFSPAVAYQFMELLEAHAVDTYGTFVKQNEKILKSLPAPPVAVSYYTGSDLYQFDEFQMYPAGSRRPPCDNLYDVFVNICDDEWEHVRTMRACQDYANKGVPVYSCHENPKEKEEITVNDRDKWIEWSRQINENGTNQKKQRI